MFGRHGPAGCGTLWAIVGGAVFLIAALAGVAYLVGGCGQQRDTGPIHRINQDAGENRDTLRRDRQPG